VARFTKNPKCNLGRTCYKLWTHISAIYNESYDKLKRNLGETDENGRGVFRKSNIIIANQNILYDAKLPYWLSLSAI